MSVSTSNAMGTWSDSDFTLKQMVSLLVKASRLPPIESISRAMLLRGARARALEEHVLHKVRDAVHLRGLAARARFDPHAHGHRTQSGPCAPSERIRPFGNTVRRRFRSAFIGIQSNFDCRQLQPHGVSPAALGCLGSTVQLTKTTAASGLRYSMLSPLCPEIQTKSFHLDSASQPNGNRGAPLWIGCGSSFDVSGAGWASRPGAANRSLKPCIVNGLQIFLKLLLYPRHCARGWLPGLADRPSGHCPEPFNPPTARSAI